MLVEGCFDCHSGEGDDTDVDVDSAVGKNVYRRAVVHAD